MVAVALKKKGGGGFDTLSYSASSAGVNVNLATGAVSGGDAAGDVISGFETLIGSGSADTLTGSTGSERIDGGAGNDVLTGGGGADTFVGGAGADTITGGSGIDTVDFSYTSSRVNVNLSTGVGGGRDTFDGGAGGGWTDTVIVDGSGAGPGQGGWTVILSDGTELAAEGATGSLELGNDASGTIVLADGSEMTFDNLERISW